MFEQSLQVMTQQYQCFLSKTSWRSDESYSGHCSEKGIAEQSLSALSIDLSFYKGLTNLSFPLVKLLLSSNQAKHICLFSISTFLGNIPILFHSFISISLQLIFFFFIFNYNASF